MLDCTDKAWDKQTSYFGSILPFNPAGGLKIENFKN